MRLYCFGYLYAEENALEEWGETENMKSDMTIVES